MPKAKRNANNQVLIRLTDEQNKKLRLLSAIKLKSMSVLVGEMIDEYDLDELDSALQAVTAACERAEVDQK